MTSKPHYSKEPYYVSVGEGTSGGGGGGMRFIVGTGAPGESVGQPGDVYLNKDNGDFYTNTNGKWTLEFNIKGAKGDPGKDGVNGTNGVDGDKGDAFTYADFTQEQLAALKGPKGDSGTNGTDGKDGFGTQAQYNEILARLDALETPTE